MIRKLRFGLCALVLFVVQAAVVHRFSYGPLRPDLLLLLAAFLALEADWQDAVVAAFLLGMLRDLGSAGRLGGTALVLVPAALVLMALRHYLVRESMLVDLALTAALVFGVGAAQGLGQWLASPAMPLNGALSAALGQAAFTTALCPLLYPAFAKAGVVDASQRTFASV